VLNHKLQRQRAILDLVKRRPVHTQEELVAALRRLDYNVTQATVSRDIKELGLFRAPGPDGTRYEQRLGLHHRAGQVLREFVLSVTGVQFMGIVHTPPGTANLVAVAIDEAGWPEVLGTVAGDDTVLVVARSEVARRKVEQRIASGAPHESPAQMKGAG
jgi:transcriptional regulator of arginine metabolism